MASLIIKPLRSMIAIRPAVLNVVQHRFKSNTPTTGGLDKPIENKVDPTADPKQTYLANPWDLLYGAERFEIAMKHKGYDDPYDMDPVKRKAVSSAADPNIIQTLEDQRIVACICEQDTHHINYMMIAKGETKRCECGHYFKCVERELPDLSEYGVHLEKSAHH